MKRINYQYDFVVIGAGLAGMMSAVSASRHGLKTALINDRPVPGGNAGKEIRIPSVGAANCNYFYSRESGLTEELLLENLFRNKTRNPEGWHLVLTSFLKREPLLDVFYNTYISEVQVDRGALTSVAGWTSLTELHRTFSAPYFADCTGDGTVGAFAGAEYMIGTEGKDIFGESIAPDTGHDGTMGMSLHFHTVDTGAPMPYEKPEWVDLKLDESDFNVYRPGIETFSSQKGGFWWIEWGGELDTIHDTEIVAEKLNHIVYAIWDYLKNRSSIIAQIETFELDWVGTIPGKRESRRLVGDHVLTQLDIDSQRDFPDAATYGGYGFDDHDPKGFFDNVIPSMHSANKGPFNIPLRSLYCRDISNLFMGGRNLSASHVGLTATRVQYTCSQIGQAVGTAAAVCHSKNVSPRTLATTDLVKEFQRELLKDDHYIQGVVYEDPDNLAGRATVESSSTLLLDEIADFPRPHTTGSDGLWAFPIVTPNLASLSFLADVEKPTAITAVLYRGPENGSTYPETEIARRIVSVEPGACQWITVEWACEVERPGWHFMEVAGADGVTFYAASSSPPGALGCFPKTPDPIRPNPYSRWAKPIRNELVPTSLCLRIDPAQDVYNEKNITSPHVRPHSVPDLWVSKPTTPGKAECIELTWEREIEYSQIDLIFDATPYIHFAQTWTGNSTDVFPSLVKDYRIAESDGSGRWREIVSESGNYQKLRRHEVSGRTRVMRFEFLETNGLHRVQVYGIRVR